MWWWCGTGFTVTHPPFLCVLVAVGRRWRSVRRCLQSRQEEKQPKTFRSRRNKRKRRKKVKTQLIICDVTPPTFSSPALGPASPAAAPLGRLAFKLWVSPSRVHERSFVTSEGTAGCFHEEGTGTLQLSDWPNVPVREQIFFLYDVFAWTAWHCAEAKTIIFCCKQELARPTDRLQPECLSR